VSLVLFQVLPVGSKYQVNKYQVNKIDIFMSLKTFRYMQYSPIALYQQSESGMY
jgi:hypothetical protein